MLIGAGSYLFRYAIGTAACRPEHPLLPVELVERAADYGFELVQFADNMPLDDLRPEELDAIRQSAERRNMAIEVGTAGAETERLLLYLAIAERLGAHLVRLAPHSPDVSPDAEELYQVLTEALPSYRRAGVAIAVENHFTLASELLASVIRRVNDPLVGVCLDTANSIAQQEWPLQTVRLLGEHAVNLHLKDYKVTARPDGIGVTIGGAPLGQGDQDIKGILDALKGKRMNMILEQWMPIADTPEETLKQEEAWIRASLAAARQFRGDRA